MRSKLFNKIVANATSGAFYKGVVIGFIIGLIIGVFAVLYFTGKLTP